MACLDDAKIQEYIAGDLAHIEANRVKDHLRGCERCRRLTEGYRRVERCLQAPRLVEPPEAIFRNVMRRIYSPFPLYSSIAALVLAAVLFLISWIYISFNFANNSLMRAVRLASKDTSNWIFQTLKSIETLYLMIQATFKSVSHFLHSLLHINVNPNVISGVFLSLSLILATLFFGYFTRTLRARQK